MDDHTLLAIMTVFVIVAALALIIQAGCLIGVYKASRGMSDNVQRLMPKIESLLDISRKTVEDSRTQLADITAKASDILETTRGQVRQISTNSGRFDLPPHSTIEICSRSASWPSAWNTNGSAIFSGHPLDEDRRAREQELGALGVELAHDAEGVVDVDRPQPLDRRDPELVAADEIDLAERGDVQQAGARGS